VRFAKTGPDNSNGATLATALMLLAVTTLLVLGAVRSATTSAQLGYTLSAADDAFQLAELGLHAGYDAAVERPASLPRSGVSSVATLTEPGKGRVNTNIVSGGTDNHCPTLAPLAAERQHFEIQAVAYAERAAVTTHILGFHICRELCVEPGCLAIETGPQFAYWLAQAGAGN
jgi:Tfp pilus assembly protein PilX